MPKGGQLFFKLINRPLYRVISLFTIFVIEFYNRFTVMTTVIINEKTAKGKTLLAFLRNFETDNFIQFEKEPNQITRKAMLETREGKTVKFKNFDDYKAKTK